MDEPKEGKSPGITIGTLIAVLISIVVGVSLIGPIQQSVDQAKGTLATTPATQAASPTSNFGAPGLPVSPTASLILLSILLIGLLVFWYLGRSRKQL